MLNEGLFSRRTPKAKLAEERAKYELWAFPHGAAQREQLEVLLKVLYPKDSIGNALITFLTAKELFEGDREYVGGDIEKGADYMLNARRKYKAVITKKMMPLVVALVTADARLDPENVQYPSLAEIREMEEFYKAKQVKQLF